MSVEAALVNRLEGYAGLTALVSTRIYPHRLPQTPTYPAVTYFLVTALPRDSAMGVDVPIARKRFQFSAWGSTYLSAKNVCEQIRLALQRWSGTADGTTVYDIFVESQNDIDEPDLKVYQCVIDFEVVHGE